MGKVPEVNENGEFYSIPSFRVEDFLQTSPVIGCNADGLKAAQDLAVAEQAANEEARRRVDEEMTQNDVRFILAQQAARKEMEERNKRAMSNKGEWKILLVLIPIFLGLMAFLAGTGLLMKYLGSH